VQAIKLAVRAMPGSGRPAELLHTAGIDADAIVVAVHQLLSGGGDA
jgi:transketolase